jgi:hypothetical protein
MRLRRTHPSWEYLRQASTPSLQSFELARLSHAANLRREIAALLDEWLEETADALVARWLRQHWTKLPRTPASPGGPVGLQGLPHRKTAGAAALRAASRDPTDAAD